ncbi:hypothetical protein I7X12_01405 [Halosimplex litoreum]|uniref:Uncharacterized protein n=1 Tax=Halosimplex litoreum TaxID=1198301 RepID=A0A7T3FYY7_9EURY|nr:hypothetical protein [Halosimplex litoreum]QPV63319.1 hypothetical protein I7X12_01405 [Halosimplex litoreum]
MGDRSPGERRAARLLTAVALVVGVALVANSATVHAFDLGGERYRYSAVELEWDADGETFVFEELDTEDETFVWGESDLVDGPERIRGIGCLWAVERPRLCHYEASLVESAERSDGEPASVTVEAPVEAEHVSLYEPSYPDRYERAIARFVALDGTFYRRSLAFDRNGSSERIELTLKPVDCESVIDALATNRSALDPPLRRVVDGGTVTVDRRLGTRGTVVETDDGYVAVVGDRTRDRRPLVRWASGLVQVAVGALLCRRGWSGLRRTRLDHEPP